MYLADGTTIMTTIVITTSSKRLQVNIDTNGDKAPNKYGRDQFEYNYYLYLKINEDSPIIEGKLLPFGAWYSREELLSPSTQYSCNNEQNKAGCAALIMKDSWQIKDDYPW